MEGSGTGATLPPPRAFEPVTATLQVINQRLEVQIVDLVVEIHIG